MTERPKRQCCGRPKSFYGICERQANLQVNGQWYCWQHSPNRRTAQEEAAKQERLKRYSQIERQTAECEAKERRAKAILKAAQKMDWQQVVINGGPPCFHLQNDGYFCGRAERWEGHECVHDFVSLADLLRAT